MKKFILFLAIALLSTASLTAQTHTKKDGTPDMRYKENKTQTQTQPQTYTNPNTEHVDTYQKKNGTVVEEHNRTEKNNTDTDNWSTKPNTNPETGKKGTKNPK
jgi:hypothetical protein